MSLTGWKRQKLFYKLNKGVYTNIYKWLFSTILVASVATAAFSIHTNSLVKSKINSSTNEVKKYVEQKIQEESAHYHNEIERQLEQKQIEIEELKKQVQAKKDRQASSQLASTGFSQKPVASGCEQYRSLISAYNWPVDVAIAVANSESGCNTHAVSPTRDHGIFQINEVHIAKAGSIQALHDPATNIKVAYQIWSRQGFRPWSVCTYGKVKCW